jgi:hypothetical protein
MKKNYQRQYQRAPFSEYLFFEDQGFIYKAKANNISEGGMLLSKIPFFPDQEQVELMLFFRHLPVFEPLSVDGLLKFRKLTVRGERIYLKAHMVRETDRPFSVEDIFQKEFGLRFTEISAHARELIQQYQKAYKKNLNQLIYQFQLAEQDPQALELFFLLSSLLGYQWTHQERESIHQKLRHDLLDFEN